MVEPKLKALLEGLSGEFGTPSYKGGGIIGRVIDDLDIMKFTSYFLSPYNPEDSLEYMSKELVTLKRGEKLDAYRKTVQELMDKSGLRQTVEEFVGNDYDLKSWLEERKKIVGPFERIPDLSRESLHKLVKTDYQILKSYHDLVEKTQEIESESSLLRKIKKFGFTISQDENYQTSKRMVETMENFGESKLHIRYDYFDTVTGVHHIRFDPSERGIKEMLGWYLHTGKVGIEYILGLGFAYFFPSRRELFYTDALEFLIKQNSPSTQKILEYRKIMDFFLGATRYIEKIKSNETPLTFPSFTKEEGFLIKELYNPCLLLQKGIRGKEDIVTNDAESNFEQNIAIITGPNNTGKTVYVKSIGLAYALAQNGFPIPAQNAQLSELDSIYTHFVHPEDITLGEGSYLDELRRIKELFQTATPKSLLIADEPIRGSSPEDAKEMSLRFIKGFMKLKAPTFLTTHLHGVAKEADNWEGVRNLQTEIMSDGKEIKPTYKIKPGEAGKSYGVEIAEKFGLKEEDIFHMIEEH